jgi:hypothetical protein
MRTTWTQLPVEPGDTHVRATITTTRDRDDLARLDAAVLALVRRRRLLVLRDVGVERETVVLYAPREDD